MSRVQVKDQGDLAIRPGASPVNRFSTPEQPLREVGPTKAMQLSSALSDLVPELLKFSAHADQRQSEDEVMKARVARAKNAVTFQQAVKNGDISPDQNPWFIKSWKEMDGSVAADHYNEDLLLALSHGDLSNSTSQAESRKLLDNFRTNWVKTNVQNQDADFVMGFRAKAAGYDLRAGEHQAATVGNNIVAAYGDTFQSNVHGILSESYIQGLSAEDAAAQIDRAADHAILVGVHPKDVNEMIIKAVAADAEENLDVTHARTILDAVNGGPGGKLGGTTAAKAVMTALESRISNELHQRDSWAYTEEQRVKQEVIANASSTVGQALLQNAIDHKVITLEQFKTQIDATYKAGGWEMAQNLQKAVVKSQNDPDSEAVFVKDSLYSAVLGDGLIDFDRLNRERAAGSISLNTYAFLAGKMNEHIAENKRDSKEPSFFKNQAYRDKSDFLKKFILGTESMYDQTRIVTAAQADSQYWSRISKWDAEHPKATDREKIEYATTEAQQLMDDFNDPSFGKMAGNTPKVISNAPGVKAGRVTPIGEPANQNNAGNVPDKLPPVSEPQFKNVEDFHRALNEHISNPTGSKLAILAAQYGMSVEQFLAVQAPLFPDTTPDPRQVPQQ